MKVPNRIRQKIDKMFRFKSEARLDYDPPKWSIVNFAQWPLGFIEFMKDYSSRYEYYEKIRMRYYPNERDKD